MSLQTIEASFMRKSSPSGGCQAHTDRIRDRDFCVNMAGCQYGRNCYDEMSAYKKLSEKLNKKRFWLF